MIRIKIKVFFFATSRIEVQERLCKLEADVRKSPLSFDRSRSSFNFLNRLPPYSQGNVLSFFPPDLSQVGEGVHFLEVQQCRRS